MDKARPTKRQLKQSGKLNSSNQDRVMAVESQGEEEDRRHPSWRKLPNKKFKLHNTVSFIDRNGVDHLNVPRKLRSAMTKRSGESLSPPISFIEKAQHISVGTEAPSMDGAKKYKQIWRQEGETDQIVSGHITKDEEEVAETLFSLARMLPDDKPAESRVDLQSSDQKTSPLQGTMESAEHASQAMREENSFSRLTCSAAECTNLTTKSNLESSTKRNSSSGVAIMGQPIGYENNKFDLPLGSYTALADHHLRTSLPSRGVNAIALPLADPSELGVSPELCHITRSLQPVQQEMSLRAQKLEYGLWPVLNVGEKEEPQHSASVHKESNVGLANIKGTPYLWPGTYRVQSCGGEVHAPSRSPSTKLPAWLESATTSTRTSSIETTILDEKVKPVVDQKQQRKRCATHVYISRLVQAYQTADRKLRWPIPSSQITLNEKTELSVTTSNDPIGLRTGLNGVVSTDCKNGLITDHSDIAKNSDELQVGKVQENRFQREKHTPYSSETKNSDVLPLSAGGSAGGLESGATTTSDNYQKGSRLVSSAQGNVPYLHPNVQHRPSTSFILPHVRPTASQAQSPQYVSNPFYFPAHWGNLGLTKQELEQQQHQFLAAQMASQCRPGGNAGGTHLPRWQNGISDFSVNPCAQSSLSSSSSELLSTKGSQQQQLFEFPSSAIGKREHHPFPRSYVEGGGGLQLDNLQLVCSAEHM